MKDIDRIVKNLIDFRKKMNLGLSIKKGRYIWGKRSLGELSEEVGSKLDVKEEKNLFAERKMLFVQEHIGQLLVFNWVKFIGVSGSVAAGFAKDEDDIDLFIVVKNGSSWLYRGILMVRGLFNGIFRAERHGRDIKDKLCLNLICEERGVSFEEDIFNLHELMYVVPIYNHGYLSYIFSMNRWLIESFRVKKELLITKIREDKSVNWSLRLLNYLSFLSQLVFMFVSRHSPDFSRLRENYKKGRIEFFEKDYRIMCMNRD